MDLKTWVERQGSGALSKLQYETRLAYTTILRAHAGHPIRRDTAERISAATGGEVSIASLLLGSLADGTESSDAPEAA